MGDVTCISLSRQIMYAKLRRGFPLDEVLPTGQTTLDSENSRELTDDECRAIVSLPGEDWVWRRVVK